MSFHQRKFDYDKVLKNRLDEKTHRLYLCSHFRDKHLCFEIESINAQIADPYSNNAECEDVKVIASKTYMKRFTMIDFSVLSKPFEVEIIKCYKTAFWSGEIECVYQDIKELFPIEDYQTTLLKRFTGSLFWSSTYYSVPRSFVEDENNWLEK